MAIVWRIAGSIAVLAGLWAVRQLFKRRRLPPPPWRVPAAAILLHCAQPALTAWLPAVAASPLNHTVNLLISFAWLSLVSWAVLELPPCWGIGKAIPQIIRDLINLTLAALLTALTLHHAKVNLVGLVTTSAVLTAVLGLAGQETLKDLLAGISMQISPPFRVGDWIEIEDMRGTVRSVTLMNTELQSVDGARTVIPNNKAAEALIRRFRPQEPVGNRFMIGLDYSHPPAQAVDLMLNVLNQHPKVLRTPAPQIWISEFADSSINYEILIFQKEVSEGERLQLRGEIYQQLWYALQRAGRSIPFPVVQLRRADPSQAEDRQQLQDVSTKAEALAANPLFTNLSAEQRTDLAQVTRFLSFGPGETIVTEGEHGDCLYQVISGRLEVLKATPGDASQQMRVATLEENSVFGEMTLCTDAPRHATVRTLSESLLLEVERRDLAPLLENNPGLLEQFGQLVSERQARLRELNQSTPPIQTSWLIDKMRQLLSGSSKAGASKS